MVKAMRAGTRIAFTPFRLDPQESCLWRRNKRIPLSATDTAILAYLVSRAGRLVTRDELLAALWPDVAVTPGVVKVRVRRLRRTLGDRAARPRFIETVHGRGYRFIARISEPSSVPSDLPVRGAGRDSAGHPGGSHAASVDGDTLRHLCRAARNAIRRRAPHEAIAIAHRALPLLSSLTDAGERAAAEQELRITLGRLELVRRACNAPEVAANYARLRALCDERPEDPSVLPGLVSLARFELHRAEIRTAQELAARVHRLAERGRHRDFAGAHTLLGAVEFNAGRLASADAHLARALSLYDAEQSHALGTAYGENVEVPLQGYRAVVLWYRGFPQRALQASRTALATARALGLPAPMAFALGMAAWLHRLRGEADVAGAFATELGAVASDAGFPFWLAQATFERGWAVAARGDTDEGRALMQDGLDRYRATGARLYEVGDHVALLDVVAGASAEHGAAIDELITSVARTGQLHDESALHRLRAEWLLRRGDDEAATASFERAIAVAAAQGAKPLERRARAGLHRIRPRRLVRGQR
jgi:DNA-binding winged helix-turn-helix (wHTH) protein/tetratricopeptide (TPR) repeat protein